MLVNVKVSNFLSIKDSQYISFAHPTISQDTFKNNTLIKTPYASKKYLQILNSLLICGPNGVGKSNFIKVFKYLQLLILEGYQSDFHLNYLDYAYVNATEPIIIKIEFIKKVKSKKYHFIYEIKQFKNNEIYEVISYQEVKETTLGKEVILFDKRGNKIVSLNKNLRNLFKKVKSPDFTNFSILSVISNTKNIGTELEKEGYLFLKNVYDFIMFDLIVCEDLNYEIIFKDHVLKQNLINELKGLNIPIIDFIGNEIKYKVDHKYFSINYAYESDGLKKIINFIILFLKQDSQKVFLIDNYESMLQPEFQHYLLKLLNKHQVILTSNSPFLLTPTLFSKEQIYFIYSSSFMSKFYNLSTYDNISYFNHNWSKLYLEGRFIK